MFEKLFGKTSDVVFHTIGPYAVERRAIPGALPRAGLSEDLPQADRGHRGDRGLRPARPWRSGRRSRHRSKPRRLASRRSAPRQVSSRRARVPPQVFSASRLDGSSSRGASGAAGPRPQPYAALLDDFERWMTEERGLSRGTLNSRRWHVGRSSTGSTSDAVACRIWTRRDLDGYLQHLHAQGTIARLDQESHQRRPGVHPPRRAARLVRRRTRRQLHGPHIYRDHGLPLGPSWDDVSRLIEDAASDDPSTSETARFSCCSPSMASGPVRSPLCASRTSTGSTTV